ncbi:ArdC family protein [Bacteroides sp. 51]|uniref:ArdC family protein n=1 Tax=Bacteroides sp. 51 TaxID=2302938 RepID=UPI0013D2F6EB|nr:zincin-like metallopeptidase domain-containing protein [Bacteroides sp. 51]NDV84773.1 DUF1738 domain-containing protein [Bacteroides sp. 51]
MGYKKKNNTDGPSAEDRALDRFAELMIEKINTLQSDWKKPWFTEGSMKWPKNLSGRDYNGMNALMLMFHAEKQGYKLPVYCTFDRVIGLNYQKDKQGNRTPLKNENGELLPQVTVQKGEKSFPVFITTFTVVNMDTKAKIKYDDYKRLSDEEKQHYAVYPKMQVYSMFNVDQTNMKEARPELYAKIKEENQLVKPEMNGEGLSFSIVDKMIEGNSWVCPIELQHQDSAYYSMSKDLIVLPEKAQFVDGESFYGTLFHEMTHSTGSENRLNRIKPSAFGSAEYAREELVAELGSALVAQRYGISKNVKEESAAYLKSWLHSLKESPDFIKTTLFDVKKASAMIMEQIDKIAQQIDNERSVQQNITERNAESDSRNYYASVAYLQNGDDTQLLDRLQESGNYDQLLQEAKEYDPGDAIDLEYTFESPIQNRGDVLLDEDDNYAVVYNNSVGGTYEIMRKVTEQEVRNAISRYGLPDRATEDVKEVAKGMVAEQFAEMPEYQREKMGIGDGNNDGIMDEVAHKEKRSVQEAEEELFCRRGR